MIFRYYKYFRWLSLDIVLGAIVFLAFLEKHYSQEIQLTVYFALAAAVWLIYTADHLIDSAQAEGSPRRRFHQKYYKVLIFIGGLIFILAILNLPFLPGEVLRSGAVLSASCISYLLLVFFFKRLWVKEVLVAVGYAIGIFLAPLSMLNRLDASDTMMVVQLFIIALINLVIFSRFDIEEDTGQGFGSIAIRIGLRNTDTLIKALILLSAVLSVIGLNLGHGIFFIQLSYLMMTGVLAIVDYWPSYFNINERFRLVGDAVFYVPVIFLW
ncbi:hypothetical protein [Marinoscillum sp. MHG1-6]|uniref:hypothetical protein n=1 Tax=Marinoscillum sp. MHG1-6 TaxID=2959627 RepID=UPI002157FA1C|nr:hypothetical protein [Marinoscillum sp. MHG1-6]